MTTTSSSSVSRGQCLSCPSWRSVSVEDNAEVWIRRSVWPKRKKCIEKGKEQTKEKEEEKDREMKKKKKKKLETCDAEIGGGGGGGGGVIKGSDTPPDDAGGKRGDWPSYAEATVAVVDRRGGKRRPPLPPQSQSRPSWWSVPVGGACNGGMACGNRSKNARGGVNEEKNDDNDDDDDDDDEQEEEREKKLKTCDAATGSGAVEGSDTPPDDGRENAIRRGGQCRRPVPSSSSSLPCPLWTYVPVDGVGGDGTKRDDWPKKVGGIAEEGKKEEGGMVCNVVTDGGTVKILEASRDDGACKRDRPSSAEAAAAAVIVAVRRGGQCRPSLLSCPSWRYVLVDNVEVGNLERGDRSRKAGGIAQEKEKEEEDEKKKKKKKKEKRMKPEVRDAATCNGTAENSEASRGDDADRSDWPTAEDIFGVCVDEDAMTTSCEGPEGRGLSIPNVSRKSTARAGGVAPLHAQDIIGREYSSRFGTSGTPKSRALAYQNEPPKDEYLKSPKPSTRPWLKTNPAHCTAMQFPHPTLDSTCLARNRIKRESSLDEELENKALGTENERVGFVRTADSSDIGNHELNQEKPLFPSSLDQGNVDSSAKVGCLPSRVVSPSRYDLCRNDAARSKSAAALDGSSQGQLSCCEGSGAGKMASKVSEEADFAFSSTGTTKLGGGGANNRVYGQSTGSCPSLGRIKNELYYLETRSDALYSGMNMGKLPYVHDHESFNEIGDHSVSGMVSKRRISVSDALSSSEEDVEKGTSNFKHQAVESAVGLDDEIIRLADHSAADVGTVSFPTRLSSEMSSTFIYVTAQEKKNKSMVGDFKEVSAPKMQSETSPVEADSDENKSNQKVYFKSVTNEDLCLGSSSAAQPTMIPTGRKETESDPDDLGDDYNTIGSCVLQKSQRPSVSCSETNNSRVPYWLSSSKRFGPSSNGPLYKKDTHVVGANDKLDTCPMIVDIPPTPVRLWQSLSAFVAPLLRSLTGDRKTTYASGTDYRERKQEKRTLPTEPISDEEPDPSFCINGIKLDLGEIPNNHPTENCATSFLMEGNCSSRDRTLEKIPLLVTSKVGASALLFSELSSKNGTNLHATYGSTTVPTSSNSHHFLMEQTNEVRAVGQIDIVSDKVENEAVSPMLTQGWHYKEGAAHDERAPICRLSSYDGSGVESSRRKHSTGADSLNRSGKEKHKMGTQNQNISDVITKTRSSNAIFLPEYIIDVATVVLLIPVLLGLIRGGSVVCELVGRRKHALLTAFVPLVSAISGCYGLQANRITKMAMKQEFIKETNYQDWMRKELGSTLILAFLVSTAIGVAGCVLSGDFDASFCIVVALGQFVSFFVASVTGTYFPIALAFKLNIENGGKWAGQIVTVLVDVVTALGMIYLGIALFLLGPPYVDADNEC